MDKYEILGKSKCILCLCLLFELWLKREVRCLTQIATIGCKVPSLTDHRVTLGASFWSFESIIKYNSCW